jgi:Fe-S-cluster containining protein
MRKLRLAIFGDCPCDRCIAACCKQNGHDYAVLLEGDERRKFAAFSVEVRMRKGQGLASERVLPYRDGRCQFLGEDDRCTIYEDRPANCRRFECISGYHLGGGDLSRHSEFLRRNPKVREMLEE